jgi:hypothetical protein
MAKTVDEDLAQLEKDIRQLKIEYEQYFGGGRSRPPADTQWRVDHLVKRYAERAAELSTGQRFRYNNLSSTYAKYVDMWRKKTMAKEGAVTQHHYGAAAKAIEAERLRAVARDAAAAAAAPPTPSVIPAAAAEHSSQAPQTSQASPAANAQHSEHGADSPVHSVAVAAAHAAELRETAAAYAMSFSDPGREKEKVKQLYQKLIEARSEAGDKSNSPSLKDFERFVHQKTSDLKSKGGQAVEYTVSIEGGRVKLKARISS